MYRKFIVSLVITCACIGSANAQSEVQSLSRCLADTTTGKDRKDLAKWLFAAMATHPEIKSLSSATPELVDEASRTAGAIFTRLLADACAKEIRDAVAVGGQAAIQAGFQVLGQLAMQELMTNAEVGASMTALNKYVDMARIEEALKPR